jgi:hypothetical protein
VPLVHFEKGESKEERVRPLLRQAAKGGGNGKVVLIGVAQEKASAWRSWKAKGQEKASNPHMEWGNLPKPVRHRMAGAEPGPRGLHGEEPRRGLNGNLVEV